MATLASAYGCTHVTALSRLEQAGMVGMDAVTSLGHLEAKLATDSPTLGADAGRAHAVLVAE